MPLCGGSILQLPAGPCLASAGDDLRAKSRHFVLCAPKRRLRAAALASSWKALRRRQAPRRAKSPALHCGRERVILHKRQPSARLANGPMQSSAPTQGAATRNCQPPARPAAGPHQKILHPSPSSTSRTASPKRLNSATATKMARPGASTTQG